ncbi:MAG: VCBS repeat-containing protein, partial [Verrucomicrobiota bacterium]
NGDGLVDVVFANDLEEIVIHYQEDGGEWSKAITTEVEGLAAAPGAMVIADLRSDGKQDLVVVGTNDILVFADGNMGSPPERFPLAFSGLSTLKVIDADRDGRLDVCYGQSLGSETYLVVRAQSEDGQFFGERFIRIEGLTSILKEFGKPGGSRPDFVSVSSNNGTLQRITLAKGKGANASPQELGPDTRQAVAYGVPGYESGASLFAEGDFDGDGKWDIVTTNGDKAEVWVFFQGANGAFLSPETYPAYSGITSVAAGDVDGDGTSELLVLSEEENALGIVRYKDGRFNFPEQIPVVADPKIVSAGDANGDGRDELAVAMEGASSRTLKISLMEYSAAKRDWSEKPVTGDKEVRSRLEDMVFFDANQDGRMDLLALSSDQEAVFFMQTAEGKYPDPVEVGEIPPESVAFRDFDGDGTDEVLLTQETFTRSVRYDDTGKAAVLDQVNSPESGADLLTSVFLDFDGDEEEELVLVDQSSGKLFVMQRDENRVFRNEKTVSTVEDEFRRAVARDIDGDGEKELLLFCEGRFWLLNLTPAPIGARVDQLHETDIEDMDYRGLLTADFNDDGHLDVVGIDNVEDGLMEILISEPRGRSAKGPALTSALHFKLFEKDQHYRGRQGGNQQPHAGLTADLNNDGKPDIGLLLHDRLLIYLQR